MVQQSEASGRNGIRAEQWHARRLYSAQYGRQNVATVLAATNDRVEGQVCGQNDYAVRSMGWSGAIIASHLGRLRFRLGHFAKLENEGGSRDVSVGRVAWTERTLLGSRRGSGSNRQEKLYGLEPGRILSVCFATGARTFGR